MTVVSCVSESCVPAPMSRKVVVSLQIVRDLLGCLEGYYLVR